MLRITTEKAPQVLVLRLEGRLEGPWVAVLEQSFGIALPKLRGRRICVDLNGVTFVDATGKARLADMYAQGAELLGEDLETKAIVAEIRAGFAGAAAATEGAEKEARQVSGLEPAASLVEQFTRLERLRAELHEVNQELATSARPLDRLAEMDLEQRQEVAEKIRSGLARWESVTQEIRRAMGTGSATGEEKPERNEGETR